MKSIWPEYPRAPPCVHRTVPCRRIGRSGRSSMSGQHLANGQCGRALEEQATIVHLLGEQFDLPSCRSQYLNLQHTGEREHSLGIGSRRISLLGRRVEPQPCSRPTGDVGHLEVILSSRLPDKTGGVGERYSGQNLIPNASPATLAGPGSGLLASTRAFFIRNLHL